MPGIEVSAQQPADMDVNQTRAGGGGRRGEESVFCPPSPPKLLSEDASYLIQDLSWVIDMTAFQPGGHVLISMESEMFDRPALVFEEVPDSDDNLDPINHPLGDSIAKIRSSEGGLECRLPEKFVGLGDAQLGINSDRYNSANPLVFEVVADEGEPYFALLPVGHCANLFRDPNAAVAQRVGRIISEEYYYTTVSPDQMAMIANDVSASLPTPEDLEEASTSEAESPSTKAGSRSEPRFSPRNVAEIIDALRAEAADPATWDFEVGDLLRFPDIVDDTFCLFRVDDGWMPLRQVAVEKARQQYEWGVTRRLYEHLGAGVADPVLVERQGVRLSLTFAEPGAFELVGDFAFKTEPPIAFALERAFAAAGEQWLRESYEARDKEFPPDHPVAQGEYIVVPVAIGPAQQWPDAEIAVNVADREEALVLDESQLGTTSGDKGTGAAAAQTTLTDHDGTTPQLTDVVPEGVDLTDQYWREAPFDTARFVELAEEGMDVDEIATELGVREELIAFAMDKYETALETAES